MKPPKSFITPCSAGWCLSHISPDCGNGTQPRSILWKLCQVHGASAGHLSIFIHQQGVSDTLETDALQMSCRCFFPGGTPAKHPQVLTSARHLSICYWCEGHLSGIRRYSADAVGGMGLHHSQLSSSIGSNLTLRSFQFPPRNKFTLLTGYSQKNKSY